MNAIFTESMATQRVEALRREAEADRLAGLIRQAAATNPNVVREQLTRTVGRLRVVLAGAAG
jgi:hypothetical protein